ncbi:hypothetical protein VL04_13215 [Chromobacterium violaceum]|nr:hypothetical protein VK93_05830 [Chromobacterium violaceum]KMN85224.1 hypothetical protein VL02_15235 [Chromobacterium violaceum]KMN89493.1 hypothetical protein VL04_13215 [Chromobacterium violaceum]KMO03535.1 hypothetical protein VL16_10970 [Chromobacterium violaceum]OLZ77743.1 hypothetical protein BS642_13970 [Chromobacterium violaceum]
MGEQMIAGELAWKIEDDDYAVDTIQGRRVIVTAPVMLGGTGSDWEGAPIFGRDYLVDLLALGLVHQVLDIQDVERAVRKASEHAAERCG